MNIFGLRTKCKYYDQCLKEAVKNNNEHFIINSKTCNGIIEDRTYCGKYREMESK